MADPRFYDNRGPFSVGDICAKLGLSAPAGADLSVKVFDVAGLAQSGPQHISYFAPLGKLHRSPKKARSSYLSSKAGWCIVAASETEHPPNTVPLRAKSVPHAFAGAALMFYPDSEMRIRPQETAVHQSAKIGANVVLAPGVVVGENCEIGQGTRIGAGASIGRGVTVGANCEIGPHVSISFAHIGDDVVIQAGARLGGSGFGFASDMGGHRKIPQLGRIVVQDKAEIGANTTIDRGALADTVIGEGAKIDNLVQIGHNTVVGRHAVVVGQAGISGSVVLGQFSVIGGMVGIADHAEIGDGVQVAAMAGVTANLPAGDNYGGFPAKPINEWRREMATLSSMSRKRTRSSDKKPTDE